MNLLDRLKPEYKEKLDKDCINILSKHDSYIDLNVIDANSLCWNLANKSLQLGVLLDLFYEIKEMKS